MNVFRWNPMSLKHLSMVRVGGNLWQTKSIRDRIEMLFNPKQIYEYEISRFLGWSEITNRIVKRLRQDPLPARVASELIYVVKRMGYNLYDWIHYVESKSKYFLESCGQQLSYTYYVYWTMYGTIDIEKVIIANWLGTITENNVKAIYCMTVIHHTDRSLHVEIWNSMSLNVQDACRNFMQRKESHMCALLFLLHDNLDESLEVAREMGCQTTTHKQRFLLFVQKGMYELVKNAWYRMQPAMRNEMLVEAFEKALQRSNANHKFQFDKRRHDDVVLFLYRQLNNQQRINVLRDAASSHLVTTLLHTAASRPFLNLLIPILELSLVYVLEDVEYQYSDFITELIYDMLEDLECNYVTRGILIEVWRRMPADIKRNIDLRDVFDAQIAEWDLPSIRALINIPELVRDRDQFLRGLADCYVRTPFNDEGPHRLAEFIRMVFDRKVDGDSFRRKVQDRNRMTAHLNRVVQ